MNEMTPDEPARRIENAALDDALDEFVERVNARDLDGLGDLLASDVEAPFLQEVSRAGAVAGLNDLILRHPTLTLTRGDRGSDPMVAAWLFDSDQDRYDLVGYFSFELTGTEEALIQRLDYVEEFSDSDEMVVERPEKTELAEWEDWSNQDED